VICAINSDSTAGRWRELSALLLKGALRKKLMAQWLPLAFPKRRTNGATTAKAYVMFLSTGGQGQTDNFDQAKGPTENMLAVRERAPKMRPN
jgi:hypothetical protein